MFTHKIKPRFTEVVALGHVNNTVIPIWFEECREPIFRFFIPDLDPGKWNLIIARIEVDYLKEITGMMEVEIKTCVSEIGTSSMVIGQEVYQKGVCCAKGRATMVHFDYKMGRSIPIDKKTRKLLEDHIKK